MRILHPHVCTLPPTCQEYCNAIPNQRKHSTPRPPSLALTAAPPSPLPIPFSPATTTMGQLRTSFPHSLSAIRAWSNRFTLSTPPGNRLQSMHLAPPDIVVHPPPFPFGATAPTLAGTCDTSLSQPASNLCSLRRIQSTRRRDSGRAGTHDGSSACSYPAALGDPNAGKSCDPPPGPWSSTWPYPRRYIVDDRPTLPDPRWRPRLGST